MIKSILFIVTFLVIVTLIICNVFYINKIIKFEKELKSLNEADLAFLSKKQLIELMESKISSLWKFISLQQKHIEQNEENLNRIKEQLAQQRE